MTNFDRPLSESVGVRTCTNPACRRPIGTEFVLQASTRHVRWFCSIECAIDSRQASHEAILDSLSHPGAA